MEDYRQSRKNDFVYSLQNNPPNKIFIRFKKPFSEK